MRSEHSWSLLDPRPVLLYLEKHDEYIVYWNGWVMTHSQALCLAMANLGIFPTPEMKRVMTESYDRLYYANGFQTRSWDNIVKNGEVFTYLKNKLAPFVKTACEGKTPQEILQWFDYKRARIEKSNDE